MPLNETHLGLIALLFPEAPLIHVLRHPLDIMVSAFSNHFTHGFFCAYALETAARHYVRVMDLVQHYRGEMTLRYLPIRYEDMVADQEASVRAMLDFVGEDFDKACLTFHENRRYARTASYAQVTEQLYDRSRFRYRHYRTASGAGDPDPAAGDRAPRLHGRSDGERRRATAAGGTRAECTVPLPVRRRAAPIANEYERGGPSGRGRSACWTASWPSRRTSRDALHLSGIVAFRQGAIAGALRR